MGELLLVVWMMMVARSECGTPDQCENNIRPYLEYVFDDHATTDSEKASIVVGCESTWKSTAKNPDSTAGGIFQFLAGTWNREAERSGWSEPLTRSANRYDPVLAIELAADVTARDGQHGNPWRQWQCHPHPH